MTTQHTPGPWEIAGPADSQGEAFLIVAGDKNIAYTGDTFDEEKHEGVITAEDEANARLIAAAPDLLAALRTLLAASRESTGNAASMDRIIAAEAVAAAAILKAGA